MGNDRSTASDDRNRWEDRHRTMLEETSLEPAPLLVEFAGVLSAAPGGRALDVACGNGRNAFLLASLGYEVTAVDFSAPAIEFVGRRAADLGVELTTVESDLSEFEIGVERYSVITNFHFLDRNLVPRIIRGLVPGGYLFFETFTVDECEVLGREMRREFLLERNEALRLFAPLRIVYYREGILKGEGPKDEPRAVARLIGMLPESAGSLPKLSVEAPLE
jgi:SAM-dependent methyltransferase